MHISVLVTVTDIKRFLELFLCVCGEITVNLLQLCIDEEMSKKAAKDKEKIIQTPSVHKNEQVEAIYNLKSSVSFLLSSFQPIS